MAAGATYEPIATTTLGSAASSITFSSIPATYTDLRVVLTGIGSTSAVFKVTFNSSATGYSATQLYGDGATASSDRVTNDVAIDLGTLVSTTLPTMVTMDIFSYAGSTYKTSLISVSQDKNGTGSVYTKVALWQNTAAIASIVFSKGGGNYAAGTTATLYGIKAA